MRCRVAIFGLAVGAAILTGGGALLLTVSVAGSVVGLADGLPGCKGDKRRAPSDAEQIEKLAKQRRRGDLTELEFRIAKRKILGVPPDEADARALATDFASGVKRDVSAAEPPLDFSEPSDKSSTTPSDRPSKDN